MFTNAIVRQPSKSMINGLTAANLGKPNYEQACEQHAEYIKALIECGLGVTILEAEEAFPDSCFVEDVALMTPLCAILTRPGAPSRRGETKHIEKALLAARAKVEVITAPGTIEAGDIMMVGEHFYIGLSDRTNEQGAQQMTSILNRYGYTASVVAMSEMLHLKTGLSYLENNHLLACGEFVTHPEFQQFDMVEIPMQDSYSANSVWINDSVLVPAGYPHTSEAISAMGYAVREIEMSEFQKLDGGLSCLSLRF